MTKEQKNKDRIKELEHELGRWKSHSDMQAKQIKDLKAKLSNAIAGLAEVNNLSLAIQIAMAMEYGEEIRADDAPDVVAGYRLMLSKFNAAELNKQYRVQAKLDVESNCYMIGVGPREYDDLLPKTGPGRAEDGEESVTDGD